MTIQKSTATYQDVAVECAKITADKPCAWRFSKTLNFSGSYAWQFVIKADEDTQVDVTVGNQTETFDVSTEFELLSHVFENVEADNYPYVEINFPIGEYYIYHTQLEHGDESSEWNPNNGGVEQDVYDLKKEVKAIENSLGTLASKNAVSVSTTSNIGSITQGSVETFIDSGFRYTSLVTLNPGKYFISCECEVSLGIDIGYVLIGLAYSDFGSVSRTFTTIALGTFNNDQIGYGKTFDVVEFAETTEVKLYTYINTTSSSGEARILPWYTIVPLDITSTNTISYS